MSTVSAIFALLAGALHVFIWTMESFTWRQPATWKKFGLESQEHADITAPMAYNQGFYNLFLAAGAIVGAVLVFADHETVGWTLLLFSCGSMLAAALVLLTSGPGYARAASMQGTLPLLAVATGVLAVI